MTLKEFDALVGGSSYVKLKGKVRIDTGLLNLEQAQEHIDNGGQIGWWVRPGYIIVDVDEGQKEAQKVIRELKLNTLMCKTKKGLHLYFKTKEKFSQVVRCVSPFGLMSDYRCADKGYVLLPFGCDDGRIFNNTKRIAPLSVEYTLFLKRKDSLCGLKSGDGRNAKLFAHLMTYKNRGATDDQVKTMAYLINRYIFAESMSEKELDAVLTHTDNYEAKSPEENPYVLYSQKGVPLSINYRAVCDYFVERQDSFVLGGEFWQYKNGIYSEAGSRIRNKIKTMVVYDQLITQSRIMECYRLILDDERLHVIASDLNKDKNLINFKNGVWDIEAKELIPHDKKYRQTLQIPHSIGEFVPFSRTRLYRYLKTCKISKNNIVMLIKFIAYCLSLNAGLKTFMVLCGPSNTGKSVIIRFIESLIGHQNTAALSMHELNKRFYPTQLHNKLVNACADNSALPLSSIESLKKITGGDQIMYEKKGKDPFFFTPFAKLIFSFNQLPLQLEEKSNAFYKRMRILHMSCELFLNDKYIEDLCGEESIEEILPFLLSLLPINKIPSTKESEKLVEGLRQDSDSIHAFISNCCSKRHGNWVSKEKLFSAYIEYCMSMGREAHKKQGFFRNIKSIGYREVRDPNTREYAIAGLYVKKSKGGEYDE